MREGPVGVIDSADSPFAHHTGEPGDCLVIAHTEWFKDQRGVGVWVQQDVVFLRSRPFLLSLHQSKFRHQLGVGMLTSMYASM